MLFISTCLPFSGIRGRNYGGWDSVALTSRRGRRPRFGLGIVCGDDLGEMPPDLHFRVEHDPPEYGTTPVTRIPLLCLFLLLFLPKLSQCDPCHRGTLLCSSPKSRKVCLIHKIWAQLLASNILGLSGGDGDAILLLRRPTYQRSPEEVTSPEVDFLSTLSPAQSESVNPHRDKYVSFGYHSPKFRLSTKYYTVAMVGALH
jgi:hypothetical protein